MALDWGFLELTLNNAPLQQGNMDIREWGVVRLALDDEIWRRSLFIALWMIYIRVHFNDDFNQSYYKLHFWSEVYVGSLESMNFKVTIANCTEVMRIATHFQLMDTIWRIRLSSMVMMCSEAHSN